MAGFGHPAVSPAVRAGRKADFLGVEAPWSPKMFRPSDAGPVLYRGGSTALGRVKPRCRMANMQKYACSCRATRKTGPLSP